jgi:cytolysin-activating lysine-acyltransferase
MSTAQAIPTETQRLADSAPHTVSHMLGEIVWLMTQSPTHKYLALSDLEWMAMPALLLNQYRLFHNNGRPVGAAFWAFLSQEAEAKFAISPPRLQPEEWKSGDRCWVVDLISPFATAENKLIPVMLDDLRRTALRGRSFKFHQDNPGALTRKVITIEACQA